MSGAGGGPPDHGAGGGALDKFLTPEAMLTPGAAGGITMLIANALANNFGLTPSYIGLGLSFLFGLLVMASARKWWIQSIYYVLNSLIIFCVAFGSGNLVAAKGARARGETSLHLIAPAYAQDSSASGNSEAVRNLAKVRDDYAKLDAQYNKEAETLAALQKNGAPQADIDRQNMVIQDLQQQKAANLKLQETLLSELARAVGQNPSNAIASGRDSNNDITKINPNLGILGGENSFFRSWSSPFHF